MLRFNTFRAQRYLRSKFVEGKYLLASEATDLELEIMDLLRSVVKSTIGDVAIADAWKVEKLSATELLIRPGEAWFKGLPFNFRGGADQLVTGAILTTGVLPVGVSVSDDSTGLGKVVTFNDGSVTPTNLYRIVITAQEELLTEVDDPFLQNANLSESTAQKIRLLFKLNIVPDSLQTESPTPYRDESSSSLAVTNYPNAGGQAAPNLVNQIVITPTLGGNGELISLNLITGSEQIDGRDLELIVTNDTALGGGHPIPKSPTEQAAFTNSFLIDSNGNKYYVNAVFNDTVSTRAVIRIDKEPDQPNPEIINTRPYTLVKRDVYATDDLNGSPQGRLHWPIATLDWDSTDGIVHESSIADLRDSVSSLKDYEIVANGRRDLVPSGGGDLSWDLATEMLAWTSAITLINPHGPDNEISAATIPLVEGGSLAYVLDLESGGAIELGTLAINVTAFGATSTLDPVALSTAKVGNIVVDSLGVVAEITAIDDENNTITTSPALSANGAASIYLDSYGPGAAPLSEKSYILAVRKNNEAYIAGLDLEDGESGQIGDGVSDQILAFIGATSEADDSPNYTSTVFVADGQSLVDAISALDAALASVSGVANVAGVKIIGGGTISWDIFNQLSFSADMFLELKGLTYADNTIDTASSPIVLPTSLDVAYVIPNTVGGGPLLTVIVDTLDNVPSNAVIVARREGTDVIVGSSSTRLRQGQNTRLYAQSSDETLAYIGASDTADFDPAYSSDIRGTAGENLTSRAGVLTDAVGDEQEDRSAYWRSDLPVTWTGTDLIFNSDLVLEIINTKAGGVTQHTVDTSDSPISLADGESAYVVIDRTQASEILTVILSGVTPVPPQTTPDKDIIILARRQDALGAGYLHIPLHKQVLEPGQSVRLGASGSGSGSGSGSLEPIPGYNWLEIDDFVDLPSGSDSKVTLANYTNASFDIAESLFRLACDKSRTVATSSGTSLTIDLAPGFTVAIGDIVYLTSGARAGQWRRIDAVGSQTSFTLDAAFTGGDASPADTLMVSQAVWTKDLVNFGSASEKTRARDQFSGAIEQIAIDYFDSLTLGDEIADSVDAARIVVSASNEGLVSDVGVPLSSEFSPIFARQPYPAQIDDYILSTNTDQERLHLAFFCNPDNVSVTTAANLLRYETSFFFEDNLANGGSLDSAYCYSDTSGTEINCTVATPAGFTEVYLDWAYIPNVNSGETKGQLQVFVDGLEIPRKVVGSTLDAYYEEIQNAVTGVYDTIRFHTDLSSTPLSIEVIKSEGVVDTSNQNTADIAIINQNIEDLNQSGFQNFVSDLEELSPVTGTPGEGQFRTFGIVNRASIPDLSNDLSVNMGVNRIITQQLVELPDEVGPNGERVFGAMNDTKNQIRFVGNITSPNTSNGQFIFLQSQNDFMEVVFYGTGLNFLSFYNNNNTRDIRATIDGGAEGANFYGSGGSSILQVRNSSMNAIYPIASGLSLGLHTIKIRNAAAAIEALVFGVEILNESTQIKVNPGDAFIDGKKVSLGTQDASAYNSSFTNVYGSAGVKGGHVLVYLDEDGLVKKDIRYTDSSVGTILNSSNTTDHSNEEIIRTVNFREFGCGTPDDWSTLAVPVTDRMGILDDNTTALSGNDVTFDFDGIEPGFTLAQTADSGFCITFVGTGLDIFQRHVTPPGSPYPIVSIDNTTVASGASVPWNTKNWVKIASGLPYGTHCVRITQAVGSTSLRISDFRIYGPKKPQLPANCVELADYYITADFVANLVGSPSSVLDAISTGIIRKFPQKEIYYNGAGWAITALNVTFPNGYSVSTTTVGNYLEYTFVGTGFDYRAFYSSVGTGDVQLSLDGSTNFSGYTTSHAGPTGTGFTAATGVIDGSASAGSGFGSTTVSGLPYGKHTLRATLTTTGMNPVAIDIITPIHSPKSNLEMNLQNALTIGNCTLSDNRLYSPIKDSLSKTPAIAQAVAITTSVTTTSTSYVPLTDMSCTIKTTGKYLRLHFHGPFHQSAGNNDVLVVLYLDGTQVGKQMNITGASATYSSWISGTIVVPVAPGVHKVDVYWKVNAGTGTAYDDRRVLLVEEIK